MFITCKVPTALLITLAVSPVRPYSRRNNQGGVRNRKPPARSCRATGGPATRLSRKSAQSSRRPKPATSSTSGAGNRAIPCWLLSMAAPQNSTRLLPMLPPSGARQPMLRSTLVTTKSPKRTVLGARPTRATRPTSGSGLSCLAIGQPLEPTAFFRVITKSFSRQVAPSMNFGRFSNPMAYGDAGQLEGCSSA